MDIEIIRDFVSESKNIVTECVNLLEKVEGDFSQVKTLETYGNNLDRIMGGAKTLSLDQSEESVLTVISDYAAVCKNVGYKAAQITSNEAFYDICVGLLIDASEMLLLILNKAELPLAEVKKAIPEEFITRLKWVLSQFGENVRSTVALESTLSAADVHELLNRISKRG